MLLSSTKPRTGKPNNDHRTVINGILWILRTGAPWAVADGTVWKVGEYSNFVLSVAKSRNLEPNLKTSASDCRRQSPPFFCGYSLKTRPRGLISSSDD
ncbi:transposase [Scytonema tolypothrichoides VB-61278]|nr:transposase [Scytonema tolypothrichoides VB-61278]